MTINNIPFCPFYKLSGLTFTAKKVGEKFTINLIKPFLILLGFNLIPYYGFGNPKSFPFEVIHNRFVLKVEVKGQTFNFMFDTGASQSVIESGFAAELGLPIFHEEIIPTLGGKISAFTTTDTTFNIVPNMKWIIAPLNFDIDSSNFRIHGIIGASKLINLHMVDINFKTKILSIDPKIDIRNFIQIELEDKKLIGIEKYLPQFPTIISSISIGNHLFQNVKLIIDTGCKYDIAIVANDSSRIKSFELERRLYKTLDNKNISVIYSDVCLLDKHLENTNSSCPIFYEARPYEIVLFGLLGTSYLKRYNRVVIDFPTKKIYFDL